MKLAGRLSCCTGSNFWNQIHDGTVISLKPQVPESDIHHTTIHSCQNQVFPSNDPGLNQYLNFVIDNYFGSAHNPAKYILKGG
jgi:hypothetical protein